MIPQCPHSVPSHLYCHECFLSRGGTVAYNDVDESSLDELWEAVEATQYENELLRDDAERQALDAVAMRKRMEELEQGGWVEMDWP